MDNAVFEQGQLGWWRVTWRANGKRRSAGGFATRAEAEALAVAFDPEAEG